MIAPSLPQDRAALIDKDFRVTLPYRRWMSDVTKRLAEIEVSAPVDPTTPAALTGIYPVVVAGDPASGYFVSLPPTYARAVNGPVGNTLAYDGSDRLSLVTDDRGTKTMTYDGSGKLIAIAGTGEYPSKTFTYTGDQLTAITVAP